MNKPPHQFKTKVGEAARSGGACLAIIGANVAALSFWAYLVNPQDDSRCEVKVDHVAVCTSQEAESTNPDTKIIVASVGAIAFVAGGGIFLSAELIDDQVAARNSRRQGSSDGLLDE